MGIDWSARRLYYSRRKLTRRSAGQASLVVGARLEAVLKQLPSSGPLFPRLRLLSEDERACHFRKVTGGATPGSCSNQRGRGATTRLEQGCSLASTTFLSAARSYFGL